MALCGRLRHLIISYDAVRYDLAPDCPHDSVRPQAVSDDPDDTSQPMMKIDDSAWPFEAPMLSIDREHPSAFTRQPFVLQNVFSDFGRRKLDLGIGRLEQETTSSKD